METSVKLCSITIDGKCLDTAKADLALIIHSAHVHELLHKAILIWEFISFSELLFLAKLFNQN